MITVICKAHKKKWIDNAIENFERQSFQDKELVLVLNGELENYKVHKVPNHGNVIQLRSSPKNMGALENIALNWMRQNQRKVYAVFDSDDWYGSSYLADSLPYLGKNHLIGKSDIKFKFRDVVYRTENSIRHDVWNPTFLGVLTDLEYSEDLKLCQEIDYQCRLRQNGYNIGFNDSKDNWIYNVTSDSAQDREDWKIWKAMTAFNSIIKNQDFKILRDNEVIWKYGDGIIEKFEDIRLQ